MPNARKASLKKAWTTLLQKIAGGPSTAKVACVAILFAAITVLAQSTPHFVFASAHADSYVDTATAEGVQSPDYNKPPFVTFTQAPEVSTRGHTQLALTYGDDIAVKRLALAVESLDGEQRVVLPVQRISRQPGRTSASYSMPLQNTPLAGQNARVQFVIEDLYGVTRHSDAHEVVIPAKIFHNGLSRQILSYRAELAEAPAAKRLSVLTGLYHLLRNNYEQLSNPAMHVGLRVAARRLWHDESARQVASVQDLLWNIAVDIEDNRPAQTAFLSATRVR